MMNRREWMLLAPVLVTVLVAGLILQKLRSGQTLAEPGVRVTSLALTNDTGKVIATNAVFLPPSPPGYQSRLAPISDGELSILPQDTTFGRRVYSSIEDGFEAYLNVVLMGKDRTSIHNPHVCMTGQGWSITGSEIETIPLARPMARELQVIRLSMAKDVKTPTGQTTRMSGVFLYWFVSADGTSHDRRDWMWRMTKKLVLKGELSRWAYVIYFSACQPGQEKALQERMKRFVSETYPDIEREPAENNRLSSLGAPR